MPVNIRDCSPNQQKQEVHFKTAALASWAICEWSSCSQFFLFSTGDHLVTNNRGIQCNLMQICLKNWSFQNGLMVASIPFYERDYE